MDGQGENNRAPPTFVGGALIIFIFCVFRVLQCRFSLFLKNLFSQITFSYYVLASNKGLDKQFF